MPRKKGVCVHCWALTFGCTIFNANVALVHKIFVARFLEGLFLKSTLGLIEASVRVFVWWHKQPCWEYLAQLLFISLWQTATSDCYFLLSLLSLFIEISAFTLVSLLFTLKLYAIWTRFHHRARFFLFFFLFFFFSFSTDDNKRALIVCLFSNPPQF